MNTVKFIDSQFQYYSISNQIQLIGFNLNCTEEQAINYLNGVTSKGENITDAIYMKALKMLEWDSILIWFLNDQIYMGSSLGGSLTYIFEESDQFLVSKSEKLLIEKQGYDSNLVSSALLEANRQIPCLHGLQAINSKTIEQILMPGMFHVLKPISRSRQEWFIDINSFCENNDDNLTVSKFTESLTSSITSLSKSLNGNNLLQLSSGIDSSIIAAAIKATGTEEKFLCINFQPGDFLHESVPANLLAKDLKLNFLTLPEYSIASSIKKGDHFLHYFWKRFDNLRSLCHLTQCFYNMSLAAAPYFGFHNLLGGHVLGVNLQIYPFINYNRFTSEGKHLYEKHRLREKHGRKTFTCQNQYQIRFEDKQFDNYIKNILGPYSFITYIFLDKRTLVPSEGSEFFIEQNNIVQSSIEFILEKVKCSNFYRNSVKDRPYSPITAEKLLKLFTFITQQTKAQTAFRAYSLGNIANPIEPLQTSSITLTLLQQKINDTLINYPKWHEFELFANLTGFRFEEHYKSAFTKKLKYDKIVSSINSDVGNSHPFKRNSFYKSFIQFNNEQFKYLIDNNLLKKSDLQRIVDSPGSLHKARTLERQANIGSVCMSYK